MQQTLDHVHKQRKETNTAMFAHINHPNFGYGVTANDIKELNGEQFFVSRPKIWLQVKIKLCCIIIYHIRCFKV